jgi:hypothetical protein
MGDDFGRLGHGGPVAVEKFIGDLFPLYLVASPPVFWTTAPLMMILAPAGNGMRRGVASPRWVGRCWHAISLARNSPACAHLAIAFSSLRRRSRGDHYRISVRSVERSVVLCMLTDRRNLDIDGNDVAGSHPAFIEERLLCSRSSALRRPDDYRY